VLPLQTCRGHSATVSIIYAKVSKMMETLKRRTR
jgi:hypothetical protein